MARVLVMAGGTGGHIFPALAIADELRSRGVEIVWLGATNGMETRIVPKHGYQLECISISGLRGQRFLVALQAPWRLTIALWQAMKVINRIKPDVVIGLGGFVTGPGGLISWLLGKPLLIHEQNAVAGLTNRLLSRVAKKVLTAFPNAFWGQTGTLVGNPVREDIRKLAVPELRFKEGLQNGQIKILVVGGSLGALRLNQVVPEAIEKIKQRIGNSEYAGDFRGFYIRHQSGKNKLVDLKSLLAQLNLASNSENIVTSQQPGFASFYYESMEFIEDMAAAYAWADIVICRAGALTISEISQVGIGSILVPYPQAVDDHQTANALYLRNAEAAFLLPQKELSADSLAALLSSLTAEKIILMAKNAKKMACPNATSDVADMCLNLVKPMQNKAKPSGQIKG